MNNQKNNNSVLFLATLGVYIGLLMAGASPGIIAQQSAAMTRNFELSEEFEVRDEFDRDPEAEVPELGADAATEALSAAEVESLVRVYLSQYFVEPAADVTYLAAAPISVVETSAGAEPQTPLFWPNDVRASAAFGVASLPRSSLNSAAGRFQQRREEFLRLAFHIHQFT
ncbi:MAG TPA: hypothetical protein PKE66_08790 [Pyrinomonadaceae bacterium]|nr:hypothetical protein [Pyrinomonadaceae bacterium]